MGKKKNPQTEGLREPIVKLGKMITNRVPIVLGMQEITKDDPEYWGLDMLLTDEQAEGRRNHSDQLRSGTVAQGSCARCS